MPIVIRGLYYDQWHPAGKPEKERRADEFVARVNAELSDTRRVAGHDATRTVLVVLSKHVSAGQVEKIRACLPEDIRRLWPDDTGARAA